MLQDGDLFIGTAPSGPGYGDVLERDPELVVQDVRDASISHRTAREVYKVVYRQENLVVDEEATGQARAQERQERIARARPFAEWEPAWLERTPPERLLPYYGEWPNRLSTPLLDWEPTDELLDEHVRELGEPRPTTSRY
jgi:acetone carboxylase, alpha subunit